MALGVVRQRAFLATLTLASRQSAFVTSAMSSHDHSVTRLVIVVIALFLTTHRAAAASAISAHHAVHSTVVPVATHHAMRVVFRHHRVRP